MARTADLVFRLAFLCMLLSQCLGQGLDSNNLRASLGAANVYTKSISTYQGAARFVKQYAKSGVCSNNRGSLCASQGATKELRVSGRSARVDPELTLNKSGYTHDSESIYFTESIYLTIVSCRPLFRDNQWGLWQLLGKFLLL